MRKIVVAAVLLLSAPSLAMAQLAATTSPPSVSSSQMPQSSNSLPTGGATAVGGATPGSLTTQVGPATTGRPVRRQSARVRRALRPSPNTQASTLPTPANH